jgi:3-hydroxyacyl-[acyl-carrier-protein] dehydratase
MSDIDRLPHRPPMRLLEEIAELVPGARCRARRRTRGGDFYFQGHFPTAPVVPACILIEMIAQAGGLAAGTAVSTTSEPLQLRVAAFGPCKVPAAAGPGQSLEVDARVVGQFGALFKVEGDVHADGILVASGAVTLTDAPRR